MLFTKKQNIQNTWYSVVTVTAFVFVLFFIHGNAAAASLTVGPVGGSESVGKDFTVHVVVDSAGQSINAVSGALTFSNNLTLESISKAGIITLWAQNPTYSNSTHTAAFQGVILNGYTGSGTVLYLTFQANSQGSATIGISNDGSSVLLNDGQGTNVLSASTGATYTIGPAVVTPPATPSVSVSAAHTADAPVFTSYQSPLLPGTFVVVKGTATANSVVTVTFTQIDHIGVSTVSQIIVPTDSSGAFNFVSNEKVSEGNRYTVVASTTDGQSTPVLSLKVQNSFQYEVVTFIGTLLAVQMPVWLALLVLILVAGDLLYRNHRLKKHIPPHHPTIK